MKATDTKDGAIVVPVKGEQPAAPRPRGSFQPGVSGNPGGRPKIIGRMRELAASHSDDAIDTLKECLSSEDGRVRVAAANALLDRAFGRPAQSIHVDDNAAAALGVIFLPAEQADDT